MTHPEPASFLAAELLDQAPLPVRAVYGIGRNYAAHARELGNAPPSEPVVFLKAATSLLADGGTVVLPPESADVQHEVEIVLLIGQSGRRVPLAAAPGLIAGYGIGIDLTARDLQRQAQAQGNPWAIAKGYDGFGPVSRFLPASMVADPANLEFELAVNGQLRQAGNSRNLLFSVAEIVAYLSRCFTLNPGDLIFTGTPEGVARIRPGDLLQASLKGYGLTLTARVAGPGT
jgi:2-keto-4-pentenoate hydratase/2-oxohepta-3-ene-1,7-dioic acid hydratase in catechol pathway